MSGRPAYSLALYQIKSTITKFLVSLPGQNPERSSQGDSGDMRQVASLFNLVNGLMWIALSKAWMLNPWAGSGSRMFYIRPLYYLVKK